MTNIIQADILVDVDKNKLAVNIFNKASIQYEKKYMDVSQYNQSLDLFCKQLGCEELSILELACGPGNISKYLLDKCHKYQVLGTDLAPNMIELAKLNCPSALFQILDCRKIAKLEKTFDAIVAGFCFPYLDREEVIKLVSSVKQSLNPKGLFYLSTIHGDYKDSGILKSSTSGDEMYFYLYDSDFIKETLTSNDFEIVDLKLQQDLTQKEKTTDLIVLAKIK